MFLVFKWVIFSAQVSRPTLGHYAVNRKKRIIKKETLTALGEDEMTADDSGLCGERIFLALQGNVTHLEVFIKYLRPPAISNGFFNREATWNLFISISPKTPKREKMTLKPNECNVNLIWDNIKPKILCSINMEFLIWCKYVIFIISLVFNSNAFISNQ